MKSRFKRKKSSVKASTIESFNERKNRPQNVGAKSLLCLKDDYSRYRRVFFLKSKAEMVDCVKAFLNEADAAGYTIKKFLCDGGKTFNNTDVRSVLESKGINLRVVMPYTPEQNSCVERTQNHGNSNNLTEQNEGLRKSERRIQKSSYLHDYVLLAECNAPVFYDQAMVSEKAEQ
ncbi:hypothetical protein ILUMI_14092 [Ignelater luminosus]|uniref:Integrase catalytic domain-containing protein n=1 Tax=Ignelater luminosus TaxID=2038154 RepID=A0A8K0GAT4_IGNLU|nr:hypothetical protein ILUMI_14092 [Ignelater luminosus]